MASTLLAELSPCFKMNKAKQTVKLGRVLGWLPWGEKLGGRGTSEGSG